MAVKRLLRWGSGDCWFGRRFQEYRDFGDEPTGHFDNGDVRCELEDHGAEAFVETDEALLIDGSPVAVKESFVARQDGEYGVAGVQIVDYCSCSLQQTSNANKNSYSEIILTMRTQFKKMR